MTLVHQPVERAATTQRLQAPPHHDQLPLSVQSALRLRGGLVPCGPGVRGVGWPDSASVRLAALAPWMYPGLIATHLTAAWVWGAALTPGAPLSTAVQAGLHPRAQPLPGTRRFQLRFAAEDLTTLSSMKVTTPLRTAIDLLYSPGVFGCKESLACQLLTRIPPASIVQLRNYLVERRRPHRNLARARARWLFTEGVLPDYAALTR